MRRLRIGMLIGLVVLASGAAYADGTVTHHGATFPTEVRVGDALLELRGIALFRVGYVLNVYAAALYAPPEATAEQILDAGVPRRLEIRYLQNIPKHRMVDAAVKSIRRTVGPEAYDALLPRLDTAHGALRDVRRGETGTITYVPGEGTTFGLTGEPDTTVEGPDFAAAYFGVWLGPNPSSRGVKRRLLTRIAR